MERRITFRLNDSSRLGIKVSLPNQMPDKLHRHPGHPLFGTLPTITQLTSHFVNR